MSSIGLTEHIGLKNLPDYFTFLHDKLRPQGRLLNHCITRPTTQERVRSAGFIDRYVFPDGELEAAGTIVSAMQDNGFESGTRRTSASTTPRRSPAGVTTCCPIGTRPLRRSASPRRGSGCST